MFVVRKADGTIYGAWTVRQFAEQEEIADNDPTLATFLNRASLDISDIDNLDKALKSLALLTRQYANALKAGTYVTKTVADTKGDFMTIYRALP